MKAYQIKQYGAHEQLSTAIQNGALTVKMQASYPDQEINQAIEDVKNGHVKR